ncbi:MAG: hypothetical protein KatS3mg105_2104 [Gemmatales bacterium]|nr:MAG: hypothetical protein KatS3mg105_2104 [Gemmatales bacterium]
MIRLRQESAPVPYEIVCQCGRTLRGVRQPRYQVATCPNCHKQVFVLPQSPFADPSPSPKTTPPVSRIDWKTPALAAILTAGLIVVAFCFLVPAWLDVEKPEQEEVQVQELLRGGTKELAEGNFLLAVKRLERADFFAQANPLSAAPAERRQIRQLLRQARLLADLLNEPLDDVVRHAVELSEQNQQEWQARFEKSYLGRSVVFEDEVRRQVDGRYQLVGYRFFVRGRPVRLALEHVRLLHRLPLDDPKRLLFGVRLAAIRKEAGGTWVIHFQEESGVLLTHLAAASRVCLVPEDQLKETVERQQEWVEQLSLK